MLITKICLSGYGTGNFYQPDIRGVLIDTKLYKLGFLDALITKICLSRVVTCLSYQIWRW